MRTSAGATDRSGRRVVESRQRGRDHLLIAFVPTLTGSSPWVLAGALLVGCVLLYYGAHWLVRGAVTIATALGISKMVIGLTLVAFGTSAPEMFVNVIAGFRGETGIALANVSGSNLTNFCVGFGMCALAASVVVDWRSFRADCWMAVTSAALVLGFLVVRGTAGLPFWSLAPLAGLLVAYLVTLRRRARARPEENGEVVGGGKLLAHVGLFLLGVAMLYAGGRVVLEAAVETARQLSIPAPLIGLTIVAAGTSVPDTFASLIAARQGEHGIAVGNLLGSNISNVLVVLSATLLASQSGLSTGGDLYQVRDYAMVVLVSILFLLLAALRGGVNRSWGIVFIATYFAYMAYRIYISLPSVAAA
ncbi:MAG: hypothetical protein DWQ31_12915 [Planctomycetota bacterium]|nr:MAG: hypothetical protein DWQ31_12915 [Planctomycetota bacterium]REJ89405.1 MAG: hypothetical protein DWQ35_18155 [Planctomycetota bacterium]